MECEQLSLPHSLTSPFSSSVTSSASATSVLSLSMASKASLSREVIHCRASSKLRSSCCCIFTLSLRYLEEGPVLQQLVQLTNSYSKQLRRPDEGSLSILNAAVEICVFVCFNSYLIPGMEQTFLAPFLLLLCFTSKEKTKREKFADDEYPALMDIVKWALARNKFPLLKSSLEPLGLSGPRHLAFGQQTALSRHSFFTRGSRKDLCAIFIKHHMYAKKMRLRVFCNSAGPCLNLSM